MDNACLDCFPLRPIFIDDFPHMLMSQALKVLTRLRETTSAVFRPNITWPMPFLIKSTICFLSWPPAIDFEREGCDGFARLSK